MGRAKTQHTQYPWRKQGGWFVQTLESGTQYRARHEGLGAKRQLVLFRRLSDGVLEQVIAVDADDLASLEKAALAVDLDTLFARDDLKQARAAVSRCAASINHKAAALDEARSACDLVRDDLRRLTELAASKTRAPKSATTEKP